MDQTEYFAGVMTGSSFDGVDAVMTAIQGGRPTVLAHTYVPYDQKLRKDLLRIQEGLPEDELRQSKLLAIRVSDCCSKALEALVARPEIRGLPVVACGVHGQTVRHNPAEGHTTQLADWARIAETIRMDVVGDFRSQDIALKGQGAPIAPAFHREIFGHDHEVRAVLNIGGIANVTTLNPDGSTGGYDTGPGNTLMDQYAMLAFDRPYDADGRIAARGEVSGILLGRLLEHPFFSRKAPKSAGRDDFPIRWLLASTGPDLKPEDVMRTALELTATTIANELKTFSPKPALLIVHGGGCKNGFLMGRLAELLRGVKVKPSSDFGIGPQLVEPACMAWYAYRNVHRIPTDLRMITGQKRPCILGARWQVEANPGK